MTLYEYAAHLAAQAPPVTDAQIEAAARIIVGCQTSEADAA